MERPPRIPEGRPPTTHVPRRLPSDADRLLPYGLRKPLTLPYHARPTVAVIVTTHNYARYLGQCLDSILMQTAPPDHLVVIDDASTDDPQSVCADLGVRCERVEFENVCDTRKHGAALYPDATWYLFVDGDDVLHPDYLERMLEHVHDPRIAVIYPTLEWFGEHSGRAPTVDVESDRYDRLRPQNYIASTSLIRREAFEHVGGWDRTIDTYMDWHLWMRLTSQGWHCRQSGAVLHYRIHQGQMSTERRLRGEPYRSQTQTYTVTLFTPFCGRTWATGRYLDYLRQQTWPHDRLRLLFYDNSGDRKFGRRLRRFLAECDYPETQYLADPTAAAPNVTNAACGSGGSDWRIEYAYRITRRLAAVYNRMKQEILTDWVWIVEDDVIPPPDALTRLMSQIEPTDAAVSGVVISRFRGNPIAWDRAPGEAFGVTEVEDASGPILRTVSGTGGGCLLLRTAALREIVFRSWAEPPDRFLGWDLAMCYDLNALGWGVRLRWDVRCTHYQDDGSWV